MKPYMLQGALHNDIFQTSMWCNANRTHHYGVPFVGGMSHVQTEQSRWLVIMFYTSKTIVAIAVLFQSIVYWCI